MSTLPKSRKIVINTSMGLCTFRWKVKYGKGHLIGRSGPGLTLTVQTDAPHGGMFQMQLWSKPYALQNEYDEEHVGVKTTLGPKDVKKAIEYALANGWDFNDKRHGVVFKPKGPLDLDHYKLD